MVCASCSKQRHNLHVYQSKVSGTNIYMCQTCIDAGLEPRYLLILVGRENLDGLKRVTPFIRNGKYAGNVIEAKELL